MMIAIPPKYAVSQVIGDIKGKSAIHLARVYGERKRNFVGQHFWARGFWGAHGGARRGGDSRLHPQAKGRRQAIGPAKSLAIDSHREVAQPCGAALASPAQPL